MKRYGVSQQNPWTYLLTIILVGLLISFSPLSIFSPSDVHAQSDNVTSDNISPSDNLTSEPPPPTDNGTSDVELPSDNATLESLIPDDEAEAEEPAISDNDTLEEPILTDNLTPEIFLPGRSAKVVRFDEEAQLLSPNGKIALRIPKGAVADTTEFTLSEHASPGSTGMRMVNLFELNASLADSLEKTVTPEALPLSDNLTPEIKPQRKQVHQFNKELEITIQHTPEELAGLDIDSLCLYYLDEETRQWVPVPSTLDRETLTLTATITHFSYYGEQANPLQNGPGRVMASQVDLHSGAATFSYPIELPPGPGGFQPSLTLNYNSGSVDEMKNKRDMGSWVGIGWSLHLGRISLNASTNEYYLDLGAASYKLFSTDGTNFRTQPEQYFKITKSGNTWDMYDREGNYYRFGGTTDSQQYYDTSIYYRWDLSYWKDTNGNEANVTYVRDIWNNSVRSAYPEYLCYNNNLIEVHFISSYDENGSYGPVRKDNPITYGSNPVPKIMENRKLDAIEIKVSSNLTRKYTFSYNTTDRVYSTDYSGIYYSGKHTLTSITQVGADGTSSLPATSFTYQDKLVYRKTSETQYTGNPGNPASLTWPFMTAVNSGYGGSVSFAYTQKPDTTVYNTWTRQVVTGKLVNSSIGVSENYTYDYTGNPTYKSTGWDQGFRGWNEVKETDAAGAYVRHFFYTTGTINGKDAEKLTGKEYRTEWYDSSNNLLKTKTYDWSWELTYDSTLILRPNSNESIQLFGGGYTAVDEDGNGDGDETVVDTYSDSPGAWKRDLYGLPGHTVQIGGISNVRIYIRHRSIDIITGCSLGRTVIKTNNTEYFGSYQHGGATYSLLYTDYCVNPRTGLAWTWEEIDCLQAGFSGYGYRNPHNIDRSVPLCTQVWVEVNIQAIEIRLNQVDEITYNTTGDITSQQSPLVLRPNSDISIQLYPGTYNYSYVDESGGGDGDSTYIINTTSDQWKTDLYGLADHTNQIGKITNVAVYIRHRSNEVYLQSSRGRTILKTNESEYLGNAVHAGTEYLLSSTSYNLNPQTGLAWTWEEIDSLQAGFSCYGYDSTGYPHVYSVPLCTQVWVEVSWATYIAKSTLRTRYEYDNHGNVITEYLDGDTSTNADDATIHRVYSANTTANILSLPARERVYAGTQESDNGGTNLKKESLYYYDGNNTSLNTPPTKGNLTRLEQKKDASNSVSMYYTYDSYGNVLTTVDAKNNTTTLTYDSTYHTYPATKTLPVTGLSESYTYDPGTNNLLTITDINGNTTTYEYDTFKRLTKAIKPGDTSGSPSIEYQYNNWGTLNQQQIKIMTKVADSNYLWQSDYFDGLGRVVQTQSQGETGYTVISKTTSYNNRGLVDKEYVIQVVSGNLTSYQSPDAGWKYTSYAYDGLGRVVTQTNADGTTVNHDYSTAWQDLVTNQQGYKTRYYYDAFQRLVKVEELNASHALYATTTYAYDTLDNLTQVVDNNSNTTTMTYDWLSRKTAMTDPDMGSWTYGYDNNGNLATQTDAKSQTIEMTYDVLNRLTDKTYPQGSGMTDVSYSYDEGDNGKGQHTGMSDAIGATSYKYDARGRLIEEKRTVDSVDYVTSFTYDGADRLTNVIYPTGENVTQSYNGRGLPSSLSGSDVGDLVTNTVYNNLGQITEINLNNGLKNIFGYWGVGGEHDISGGYYGRLWEIKTSPQAEGEDWLSGWDNRVEITIDSSKIDSDLTHFPVLIHLSGDCGQNGQDLTAVFDEVSDNYSKIAVTTGDSLSQLYVEVEKWDAANEEAWLWVSKENWTISSTENTTLYLYYDNDQDDNINYVGTASSTAAQNVWDSYFVLVDHMQDDPDTSHTRDSTSNNNDGTKKGAGQPSETTGKIGDAENHDGTDDYTNYGTAASLQLTGDACWEFWINRISFIYHAGILGKWYLNEFDICDYSSYIVLYQGNGTNYDSLFCTNTTITNGAWSHYTVVRNASTKIVSAYKNGVLVDSKSYTYVPSSSSNIVTIGRRNGGTAQAFNGLIDEVRISNIARSAAWLKATYSTCWDDLLTFSEPEAGGGQADSALMDIRHTWDEGGNLYQRQDVLTSETESFSYDFLDRLLSASGPYSESLSYNEIGNIMSKNGVSYTYGTKPHAVTQMGSTSYAYDNNGNMTTRDAQTLAWDAENRPVTVSDNGTVTYFVYDGDGNRVKKLVLSEGEGTETTLYINKYYEVNLTTGNATSYYYHGGTLVAMKQSTDLRYLHQDHLSGTALVTDSAGNQVGTTMKYLPYGGARSGSVPTDKKFTGQRLDDTGLYYYGARYYDAGIGRFISADTLVPHPANPQAFNRYSYVFNNPLRYTDPSGHIVQIGGVNVGSAYSAASIGNYSWLFCQPGVMQMVASPLFQAWDKFRTVVPSVANYLIEAKEVATLQWGSLNNGHAAETKAVKGGAEITIDTAGINESSAYVASIIGHESGHAVARFASPKSQNSIFEESVCFNLANYVADRTGSGRHWDITLPNTIDMISGYKGQWLEASLLDTKTKWQKEIDILYYHTLKLWPSRRVFDALQTQIIKNIWLSYFDLIYVG